MSIPLINRDPDLQLSVHVCNQAVFQGPCRHNNSIKDIVIVVEKWTAICPSLHCGREFAIGDLRLDERALREVAAGSSQFGDVSVDRVVSVALRQLSATKDRAIIDWIRRQPVYSGACHHLLSISEFEQGKNENGTYICPRENCLAHFNADALELQHHKLFNLCNEQIRCSDDDVVGIGAIAHRILENIKRDFLESSETLPRYRMRGSSNRLWKCAITAGVASLALLIITGIGILVYVSVNELATYN
ncbi:MAG: hypothetical protein A3F09_05090 [Chlamydiae bacterium RIFCSPHIGHO2_12_FULL_49_11]|nr:MAG: hypothetical protein A3F09_05090 [Chlamydiae bacterium RIFCSPHIGHO2_12_FULL_49_11]